MPCSTPGTAQAEEIEDGSQERAVALPEKAGGPALEPGIPMHFADYYPMTTYK
jgi:hypothetical protein